MSHKKFRKKQYFKMILEERKKTMFMLDTYIDANYTHTLNWNDFLEFSDFAISEREKVRDILLFEFRSATSKNLPFGYTQMSYLKKHFPVNYEKILKNFQKHLIQKKYKQYDLISPAAKKRFEEELFESVDSQVKFYDECRKKH